MGGETRRRISLVLGLAALPALMLTAVHCAGGSADEGGAAGAGGNTGQDASPCYGTNCGGSGGSSSGGAAGSGPPPEKEIESSFRSPVATGKYVWAANPESGRVALIDAQSLEVQTFEAGNGPTHLAALVDPSTPNAARAIGLNVKSHDATVLFADEQGKVTTKTAPVHADANGWAISAKGRWALAWTDAAKIEKADPTEGFQDVTVLDLAAKEPKSVRLSVGYRPTRVFIAKGEKRAFVVTEPGLSIIELDAGQGPFVTSELPVTDDPLESPASRDVSVTPDGAWALVRRDGSSDVGVVSLADGKRVSVKLSGPVTDLDLSDDGSRAIAVVRQPSVSSDAGADDAAPPSASSDVALLPIPGIFSNPTTFDTKTIDGESFGSVSLSTGGGVALLFTNATPNDHLTLLNTAPGAGYLTHRTVALKAPVKAVFPAPDGSHAVALLAPSAGSTKAGAFSVIPVSADLPPKIQGTDAPPVGVAIQGNRALITVRDDPKKLYATYLVRMPELQIDPFKLSSPPLATGMVPAANVGYVAQEHPEGRITFVTLQDGKARTLTGFELGAKVVDGSQ